MTTRRQLRVSRDRTPRRRRDACHHRESESFDIRVKTVLATGYHCILVPWNARGPAALVAHQRFSVTAEELHLYSPLPAPDPHKAEGPVSHDE
jgi:hypothetical protein